MNLAEYLAYHLGTSKEYLQKLIDEFEKKKNMNNVVDMYDSYSSDKAANPTEELDDTDKYGDFSGCSYPDGDTDR